MWHGVVQPAEALVDEGEPRSLSRGHSRIVVAGVCMTPNTIRPAMAINKEIDLRFVVGYTPLEFRDTLHMLADGRSTRRRS